jgi:D-alanyl-D-alanine carboxypeptidase
MNLIKQELGKGKSLELILKQTAIPGFSEHHGGCAVDICTEGKFYLSEEFEKSEAFAWLRENARRYSFKMSYPRDNKKGIIYEPWHWLQS